MQKEPLVRIIKTGEKDNCTLTVDFSEITELDIKIFFDLMVYLRKSLSSDFAQVDTVLSRMDKSQLELREGVLRGYIKGIGLIEALNNQYAKQFKDEAQGS